jgi:flagellar FliJ protein
MPRSQLAMVAEWERQKEQKLSQDFQIAQQYVLDSQAKLSGLESYRMDYLKQAQLKAQSGVGSLSFNQHQQFISKLDKACELQIDNVNKAKQVAEQRKAQWLQQQCKRKAVDLLLEKQHLALIKRENKQEQMMLDELTIQKYIRA